MNDADEDFDQFLKKLKAKSGREKAPIMKVTPPVRVSHIPTLTNPQSSPQSSPESPEENSVSLDTIVKDLRSKAETQPPLMGSKQFSQMVRQARKMEGKIETENGKRSAGQKSAIDISNCLPTNELNKFESCETEQTQTTKGPPSLLEVIKKTNMRREMNKKGSKLELFFNQKKFCFVPFGMNLSKSRVELMTELIRKRGGLVLPLTTLVRTSSHDVIVITSKDVASFETLRKLLPCNITNPEDYLYIDCEWISKCMLANKLVDHCPFCLNLSESVEIIGENSGKGPSTKSSETMPEYPNQNIIPQVALLRESDEASIPAKYESKESFSLPITIIDDDDKVEDFVQKDIQVSIDKLKSDNKIKNHTEERYLYDYSHDGQSPKLNDLDDEIKIEDHIKISDDDKNSDDLEVQFLGIRKKKFRTNNKEIIKEILLDSNDDNEKADQENFDKYPEEIDLDTKEIKNFKIHVPNNKKELEYWTKKKNTFVCHSGTDKNKLNDHITKELEKLLKVYTNQKDQGRILEKSLLNRLAYRKAITILKAQRKKIESEEDANDIPGIGKKIKEKIKEILTTGKLRKAELLTKDDETKSIEDLTRVWGIGVQKASMFYQRGIKTVEDLKKNQHLLNENQRTGLKYLEEFEKRIPREEVTEIVDFVKAKIEELSDIKGIYEVICCGSYRRGKPTCGDIDILVTRKDENSFVGFLIKLIRSLTGVLLTDHLALPVKPGSHGCETYMGVCSYKGGPHRRIDIKVYPREQFGFAILYFTGSDWFNRSMRLWARKLGYTLGDHGLYPAVRMRNEKVWVGQNIPCYTEEEVFKALQLDYKTPSERDIG